MPVDRMRIDPENRYPAEGLRLFERIAHAVLTCLPGASIARTRDVIQIDFGGEEGIVVVITPDVLELRLPTVEWTGGTCGPVVSSRLWKRIPLDRVHDTALARLLASAQRARRREFRKCRYCGKRVPPEHRITQDVCHDCASKYLGVVFSAKLC